MNEQWQIAADAAHRYERIVARHIFGPWAPALVNTARLSRSERVLDLACGTGVVARIAAEGVGAGGYVVGLDLNPAMISVARSLPIPAGADITWLEGSALAIPLPDMSFDVILCQQGLQFFPDRPLALREMRRVLDRSGRVALSVWSSSGFYNTALATALARFAGQEIAARFHASRKVPARDELERVTVEAGFSDVEVHVSRIDVHLPRIDEFALEHLAATPIAAAVAALDSGRRKEISASVLHEMRRFQDGDGVTYPEETHVITGRVP